jgi:hypothetical protein
MAISFGQIIKYAIVAMVAWYVYSTYIKDNSLTTAEVDEVETRVSEAAADAGVTLEEGDTVVDEVSGEPFTVIQGGGYPAGGLGGLYRPEGFQNTRPRALGSLGMQRNVRGAMEGFENTIPRALGDLGMQRTTQVAMDVEGGDQF